MYYLETKSLRTFSQPKHLLSPFEFIQVSMFYIHYYLMKVSNPCVVMSMKFMMMIMTYQ